MTTLACLNGTIMPADEARVPIWDRGFLFGDAVYEVYRLYDGRCWIETSHTARLRRSLAELEFPPVDFERLEDRSQRTIEASGVKEGILYIQITRGVAPRTHAFPNPPVPPTELIVVRPYDDGPTAKLRETGVAVKSEPDQRWGRCDCKTVNLLGNVLANEAAVRQGAHEAVLYKADGTVTEATHSSLLWVRDGRLQATPEGHEILPGTTRSWALKLAEREGIPFDATTVRLDELARCDEVLLAGTTIEVLPVVQLDGKPIANGQPGPITRRLQNAFGRSLRQWLESSGGAAAR